MKIIDMESWDRLEHFRHFSQMDYPQFNVCVQLDVTTLVNYSKHQGLPFYYAMMFAVTEAANCVQNFRYRIRGGTVVEHERVHPSFTHMDKGSDLFKYVTADLGDDVREFAARAQEKARAQKGLFGDVAEEARDDVVYVSCVPWIAFTSISHPITLSREDSIPRLSWGKYYADGDRIRLPFSVQVHHALMDGVHVGKYLTALESSLERL